MQVKEFRKTIKLNSIIIIEDKEFKIQQLVKFRLNDGSYYIKLFFTNGYVLADDLDENIFILVREIDTDFKLPFEKELVFNDQNFNFTYSADAIAEEVKGDGQFKINDQEKFWDYEAEQGNYLSLGIDKKTGKRMDLVGKIIQQIKLK
jgi:hypothetical protein